MSVTGRGGRRRRGVVWSRGSRPRDSAGSCRLNSDTRGGEEGGDLLGASSVEGGGQRREGGGEEEDRSNSEAVVVVACRQTISDTISNTLS